MVRTMIDNGMESGDPNDDFQSACERALLRIINASGRITLDAEGWRSLRNRGYLRGEVRQAIDGLLEGRMIRVEISPSGTLILRRISEQQAGSEAKCL